MPNWELKNCCDHDQKLFIAFVCAFTVVILLPTSLKMETSFEEGWRPLQTTLDRLINQIEEGGGDNSSFTTREYMSFYTSVYQLRCATNTKSLYGQYKKVFEGYINSNVLPSLRDKKDELLLRELLKRWSNYKIIIKRLSRFFSCLETAYIQSRNLPSLEETAFLSFHDLVYDEVNKQVMEAILALLDQGRAGKQIDRTLVNDMLTVYTEIADSTGKKDPKYFAERMIKETATLYYDEASKWIASASPSWTDNTPKEDSPAGSLKKINLISSDGDVFEVDYDVALVSKTIQDVIESNPVDNDSSNIPLTLVSSEMLGKVIEYCKKHNEKHTSDIDLNEWDADFVNVDRETLFDLIRSANYLHIKSLLELTLNKLADMTKGMTPAELRHFYNVSVI